MLIYEPNKSVLTPREVAWLLSVHVNTVRRWSNCGILKVCRIGPRGDRRFKSEDVISFLESNYPRDYLAQAAEGRDGHDRRN
jgi:excisionase family DNA binding protein